MDSFGDSQWRPSGFILLIPDFDLRAVIGKKLNDGRQLFISSAMHGGLAFFIDSIDITTEFPRQINSGQSIALDSGVFSRRMSTDAGCDHQRRRTVIIWNERIGTETR